jgi:uncharacterized membrane protein
MHVEPLPSPLSSAPLPPVDAPEFCVVARPNDSLARKQRWMAFGLTAAASLGVAVSLAMAGAWPVLPYSLLELALLGVAFHVVERRARNWERLTVAGDRVILEQAIGGRRERREFNRWWLKVEMIDQGQSSEPRLTLRFAGEEMPFGAALPPARRAQVGRELKRLTALR